MSSISEKMRPYMKARRDDRRAHFIRLWGGKCVHCGTVERLEFDHKDPTSRIIVPANLWSHSMSRIFEELAKCQLLCHDCHWEKTKKDLGWCSQDVHGSVACYRRGGCRCAVCRAGNARRTAEYRAKYGRKPSKKKSTAATGLEPVPRR